MLKITWEKVPAVPAISNLHNVWFYLCIVTHNKFEMEKHTLSFLMLSIVCDKGFPSPKMTP